MRKNINGSGVLPIALTVMVSLGMVGCGPKGDQGHTVSSSPEQMKQKEQADIDRIKNDPNMPPQAKAAALQGMEEGKRNAQMMQQRRAPSPQ